MIDIYIFKHSPSVDLDNSVNESDKIPDSQTLITTLLVTKYHLQENQIQIAQNEYGKPYIIHESSEQSAEILSSNAPQTNLHFSITHAGETTLIAISDQPIGIDAEQISELSPDSISHFLCPDEYAYCTAPLRTLEVWTKKEAISKYLGYGLNIDFSSFSVFDKNADYSLATFVKNDMVISLCTGTATDIQQLYWHTSYIEKIFSLI